MAVARYDSGTLVTAVDPAFVINVDWSLKVLRHFREAVKLNLNLLVKRAMARKYQHGDEVFYLHCAVQIVQ